MKRSALVIGGTGPTGPSLVNGLLAQGVKTAILHTGRHEVDTIPPQVEHIHTNPFKIDELAEALDVEIELASNPAALATPARPFLISEHTLHQ
jgi:hypothetical protein